MAVENKIQHISFILFLSFFSMENILTLAANLDKISVCERKIMWFSFFFLFSLLFGLLLILLGDLI